VPDKLSEGEFWKRYFQSRFFHRSRSGRGANEPDDEIFDKALEEDEEETKSAPKRIKLDHINRLVDLSTTEEDHLESYLTPDGTMNAGKTKESKEAMPLIRRFNRYAQRVLNSTIGPKRPSTGPESLDVCIIGDCWQDWVSRIVTGYDFDPHFFCFTLIDGRCGASHCDGGPSGAKGVFKDCAEHSGHKTLF
jgi:hypothetical protein